MRYAGGIPDQLAAFATSRQRDRALAASWARAYPEEFKKLRARIEAEYNLRGKKSIDAPLGRIQQLALSESILVACANAARGHEVMAPPTHDEPEDAK